MCHRTSQTLLKVKSRQNPKRLRRHVRLTRVRTCCPLIHGAPKRLSAAIIQGTGWCATGNTRASAAMYTGPSLSPALRRPTWTDRVFIDSWAAERDLCADRPSFVLRDDIMECLPQHIRRLIEHHGDDAQIKGFTGLFTYLNSDHSPEQLRRLIVIYFQHVPSLRAHLS